MIKMLNRVHSVRTISFDNGNRFADYVRFSIVARDDVYFSNPYAIWQPETNWNTNGRTRRFWPKKLPMATLTDQDVVDGIFLLNFDTKKGLGWVNTLKNLYWYVSYLWLESSLMSVCSKGFFKKYI